MKLWQKSWIMILCSVLITAMLAVGTGWLLQSQWKQAQPKFHDLTVELGTESVSLRQFMTEHADPNRVQLVSDPGSIDLNKPGSTQITLSHAGVTQTVTFTVRDTTAPQVKFAEHYQVDAGGTLPQAPQLVESVTELDGYTIAYVQPPVFPVDYEAQTVAIAVTDNSGNQTLGYCTLTFKWLKESYTLELGCTLTKEQLLLSPSRDQTLLDQSQIDKINRSGLGSYTVTSLAGAHSASCTVTVVDTTGPDLQLQDVTHRPGSEAKLQDFIVSVGDPSGVKEVKLLTELGAADQGNYTVTIEATDHFGNVTRKDATFYVSNDRTAPRFTKWPSSLVVEKNSDYDFMADVQVEDSGSGVREVICDTSGLDLTTAGVYYITYHATDMSGNTATVRRRVEVAHDEADLMALAASIAAELENDPVIIKDYVCSQINYSHEWGGDDPAWYGFKHLRGNCYVHAMCLKALLDAKGYNSQLIWVKDKSHYWLLVQLGDSWKHIDPTPGSTHQRYDLMNDEQRLKTLSGRTWDTSLWPACE